MPPEELLARVARTLREDVGPAVGDSFAKTQAFMGSVVLTKIAGQLRARDDDAIAADTDRRALVATVRSRLGGSATTVSRAVDALEQDGSDRTWNVLVTSLYDARDEIGVGVADELLGHVRAALRARLDRSLVYSA